VVFGFTILCINTWQLSKLTGSTPINFVAFLMALRGLAFGATVQSTFATALGTVDRMRVARGSSLINSTRFVVQSIGVAVFATIIAGAQSPAVRQLTARMTQQPAAEQRGVGLCESTRPTAAIAAIPNSTRVRACDESMTGFESAYRVTFIFAVIALLLSAFLPGWPFRWEGRAQLGAAPSDSSIRAAA
jgi:hypothetical protein